MLSKIDQRHDMDASKYYTISFDDFAKLTGSMRWTAVMQIICAKPLKTWKTGCSGFPLGMISTKRCRGWTVVLSSIWRKRRSACALTQISGKILHSWQAIIHPIALNTCWWCRAPIYACVWDHLSYDNGNRDYSYNNGLIFEPVTEEVLQKFPNKRKNWKGSI